MPKIMLNGKLYDTDAAKFVGQKRTGPDFWQGRNLRHAFVNLYRTEKGAFFTSDEYGEYRAVSEAEARPGHEPGEVSRVVRRRRGRMITPYHPATDGPTPSV